MINVFLQIISVIGCVSHTDCPSQRACMNAICADPCAQSSPCDINQECQVQDHQPVCMRGKFLF